MTPPIGLVYMWVEKFASERLEWDELVGVGMLALAEAIASYDPGHNASLETWCSRKIRWSISDYARREISPTWRTGAVNYRGRAVIWSMDEELPADFDGGAPGTKHDVIAGRADVETEAEARMAMSDVMALPERERYCVVRELIGHTHEEIGDDLGTSKNNVTRILKRARTLMVAA